MSKKLDKSLMDAYLSMYEDKRGHAAGSSDAEKQASQLASDVRYKAKGKMPEGATDEEKRKIFLQILNASPASSIVKQMAKEKLLGEQYLPEEEYDHYKDRMAMAGRDISSKDKKDATTLPQSERKKVKGKTVMQKELEKKYGKGKSALDMVKADHKDEIMDMDKKEKKKKKKKKVDESVNSSMGAAKRSGKLSTGKARRNANDIRDFMAMGKNAAKNEKLNKARAEGPAALRKTRFDMGTKVGKRTLMKGMEKVKRPMRSGIPSGAVARAAGGLGAGLVAADIISNQIKRLKQDDGRSKDGSEMRESYVSEGNKLNRAIKEVKKTASVKPLKPKKKRQDTGDDGTANTEFNENVMSPVELAIAKKRGRVREGFSAWRTDIRFNEQLKK